VTAFIARQAAVAQLYRVAADCNYESVRNAYRQVCAFLQARGLSKAEVDVWELVLAEAANNTVKHTAGEALALPIQFEVCWGSQSIEIRIADHSPGFDWPEEVSLPEDDSEHGRGLFIIQSMVDEAQYLRGAQGNCLVLRRSLRGSESASETARTGDPGVAQLHQQLAEKELELEMMAEEVSSAYESLSAIFRFSSELNKVQQPEEFARRLLNELLVVAQADLYVFRLFEPNPGRLQVFAASRDPASVGAAVLSTEDPQSPAVEFQATRKRQDAWFDSQQALSASDPLRSYFGEGTGVAHPIFLHDSLIGVLSLARVGAGRSFKAGEVNIIHTFADFLAVQIVNSRLQEEQFHSRLVSRELEIATQIQRALLPRTLAQLPGLSVAGYCESARQVGGDFYDVLPVGDQGILLAIADVMGKGIPSAMFAAIFRSMVRSRPELTRQPALFMDWLNQRLYDELSGVDMFITAQLGYLDMATQRVRVASAGHCPLLYLSHNDPVVREVAPEGMPLGVLPDTHYDQADFPIDPGMRLLMFTDGLPEARDPGGNFWGMQALQSWIGSQAGSPGRAEDLKESLASALRAFQVRGDQGDDQTFIVCVDHAAPPPL
jgi:serine phosphatase RsbU (regulator of sigma subunit)/anti-sigma regulatory factor (Ser/Thr protein kinase)